MFAVTLRLSRTVRNLPKPPVGERTALKSAPSSREPVVASREAEDHAGTRGVEVAKAAPRHWMEAWVGVRVRKGWRERGKESVRLGGRSLGKSM